MSLAGLVEYGSSDESDNDDTQEVNKIETNTINSHHKDNTTSVINVELKNATINDDKIQKSTSVSVNQESRLGLETNELESDNSPKNIFLDSLPKPKSLLIDDEIEEEDDDIPVPVQSFLVENSPKKEKGPVKISFPSLSEFDDLDEGDGSKKIRLQSSKKLPGVLALLPPPKDELISTAKLIPHVLTKIKTAVKTSLTPTQIKNQAKNQVLEKNKNTLKEAKPSSASKLDSESEDEDNEKLSSKAGKSIDFFSLSEPMNLPLSEEIVTSNMLPMEEERNPMQTVANPSTNVAEDVKTSAEDGRKLTSIVMNLPKEEIILKNKAEVGPKLPVPEQEFNIDAEGNVAFDEKAIEYLCGKRGVKRKNQLINETDIIDINGEDIKPDEREWLVKALTEEPVPRPVSLKSTSGGQSKKKHQITYLAEQAKAMELELKNQWSANRLARRQTKSKYGF